MAGKDERDATSAPQDVPAYEEACGQDVKGLTIGVPKEFLSDDVAEEVRECVRKAVEDLEKQGAAVRELSLPLTPASVAVYFLIAKAESSANLARYDALRFAPMADVDAKDLIERYIEARGKGFGPEVKRAILMGTYALSAGYYDAWYKQASKVRTLIRQEYEAAFQQVDVIAGPTAPEVAFPVGSKIDDPLQMYLADALTVPMSVAGLPALSVPCGFGKASGLPVGLQLTAPHFKEECLFQVGHVYEQIHGWYKNMPALPQ
jgi:aspartyl-tRNA(Asn)/glutamyl-tRNA(Gln) amidotransferase subunit A